MPSVNPKILVWARVTAGLSLEDAAKAIGLQSAKGLTGRQRLARLEDGTEHPSRPLLLRMAKKYRRPLLVFYLSSPPRKGDRGEDFRTFPGERSTVIDPGLDALIRNLKTRHQLVKSLLEDDEAPKLPFVGSQSIDVPFEKVASMMSDAISFNREDYRRQSGADNAFTYLRNCIERIGVFVLLIGDLGSHHSRIGARVFRGYAIADPIAPIIVVNDQDARVAWSFTALHELTHVWLGTTGISGGEPEKRIEAFCNSVASEILLPFSELRSVNRIKSASTDRVVRTLSAFADDRNISTAMVAFRLYQAGLLDRRTWGAVVKHLEQNRLEFQHEKKPRGEGGSRPNYYIVRRHRLGAALVNLVSRYLSDGSITHTKAGKVLGVKPRNVEPLLAASKPGGAS